MNETKNSKFKKRAASLAVASCLSFAPWVADAAGLGKLTVLSGLGQPLRAELDIGATKDEVAGMTARLAPQDVFKQAGVDFASVLLDLRFAVEKRPNGQSVVKVTSAKPINEPFLDFLVELNWPAGRLVREYTFLLDPPEIAATQSSRPVAEARIVDTVRGGGSGGEFRQTPVKPMPRPAPAPVPKAAEPKQKPDASGGRVVQRGETLRKIAAENQYDGVSLEQMLVGLFQNNPDAFIAKNVNRLKAGAILNMPEKSAVEAISPAEAKKVYVAQASDWRAYRQKLAATTEKMAAKDEAGSGQAAAGKITAKVEEKVAPAEQAKDQVKVARADGGGKGGAAGKASEMADQVAKDKALKDAQDRLLSLEKNVNELQKLLELKNQKLAELQQPVAKKEEPKVVEAAKPVEPPKPVEAVKPAEPKAAELPKAPEAAVAASKPPEVKAPESPKPPERPKVVAPPPPPPPEEPGFVDSLLQDPLPVAGGAGILALLAGYFLVKRRRSQNASVETTALPVPSSLGPNSVFRMTGGQSIDTGNIAPMTGEFSQTGPGTIDTDEVDPVAEADVYMAYGRDTQAEEILLEALQKDPQRTAIHAKLLEIYANRRSVKQFETLAGELYTQTTGVGPDWEKAVALGLSLDPKNPLYATSSGRDAPAVVATSALDEAPLVSVQEEPVQQTVSDETPPIPGLTPEFERDTNILPTAAESAADQVVDAAAPQVPDLGSDAMTLDFDLGVETIAPDFVDEPEPVVVEKDAFVDTVVTVDDSNALDFDFGGDSEPVAAVLPVEESPPSGGLDFDLAVANSPLLENTDVPPPNFSPAGTLVLPSSEEADVGLSTWVGGEGGLGGLTEEPAASPEPALDHESPLTNTVVNELSGTDTLVSTNVLTFGEEADDVNLADTVVNAGVVDTDSLEFDVKLTDSMFLGQPMGTPEFDIGSINLDLSEPPAAAPSFGEQTLVHTEAPSLDEPMMESLPAEEAPAVASVRNEQWEEVNTKLDLAKAYEEMGDLEGARELLQEVVGEGPVDLVEQARTILSRIGE